MIRDVHGINQDISSMRASPLAIERTTAVVRSLLSIKSRAILVQQFFSAFQRVFFLRRLLAIAQTASSRMTSILEKSNAGDVSDHQCLFGPNGKSRRGTKRLLVRVTRKVYHNHQDTNVESLILLPF